MVFIFGLQVTKFLKIDQIIIKKILHYAKPQAGLAQKTEKMLDVSRLLVIFALT
jgi:hypothetical protein